ncbi:MAG: sulfatase, partial [Phycisphaerae bacterium]
MRLTAFLAAMSIGCQSEGVAPRRTDRTGRDVVLIVIDTLRADHCSVYGYDRPTTPNIDRLSDDGVVFTRAVSSSSFTGPSVASIMTGRYPRFNSYGNGHGYGRLAASETTIAEMFKDAGYTTAAFVCNPILDAPTGLDQGFDVYDARFPEHERVRRNIRERTAPRCTDDAIAWLETAGDDAPFFLWLHYQDPHGPYTPPDDMARRFAPDDPGEAIPSCGRGRNAGEGCVPWYQFIDDVAYFNVYQGRYDAEIAYMDQHLGRLLDWLRDHDRYANATIILTADHGEAMGEHQRYFCHGHSVTRDQTIVPMILKHPGVRPGTRVAAPVGHIDIFPTLAAIIGATYDASG